MFPVIESSVLINSPVSMVWKHLTEPGLMKNWMGEPEMNVEILSDWKIGHPFIIKGYHHVNFENHGKILQFQKERVFEYTHLSSVSRLPDEEKNYSIITFKLDARESRTLLRITAKHFPTETIFRHLKLYWNATGEIIKEQVEGMQFRA